MKKLIRLITLVLLLSSCGMLQTEDNPGSPLPVETAIQPGIPAQEPTPIMPPPLQGDTEIQQLMLTSHERWQSIQATYLVTMYPANGSNNEPEAKSHQIWVRLPAEFKVIITNQDGETEIIRVSDGTSIRDSAGEHSDLPPDVQATFTPPNVPSDTVYLHPLAGFLGTPVSDLIFPAGLAQRGGEYKITGVETIAGREASVVEWSREESKLIDRFWVDRQTGVILRQQNYGKQSSISPVLDIQATYIAFDPGLTDNTFELAQVPEPTPTPEGPPPGLATVTVLPQVLNVRSGPNTDYKVVAMVESGKTLPVIGKTEAEDWWKVDLGEGQTGWVVSIYVEFSGDASKVPVVNY